MLYAINLGKGWAILEGWEGCEAGQGETVIEGLSSEEADIALSKPRFSQNPK